MFGISKKIATSMAELLIILAIIGILSALYRKTVNPDAVAIKFGYKTLLNNMIAYAATQTNSYENELPNYVLCDNMYDMVNTLGDKNCDYSVMPVVPNFITTSGLRFFGLEQSFKSYDNFGEPSMFISVDLDGLLGANKFEEDIFPFELTKSGRIRPTGSPSKMKNNVALDAELYAVNVSYIPEGAENKAEFKTIGNRISFAEAQCLGGNPFPYRDAFPPHKIQMCVEDANIRTAINNAAEDSTKIAARDEAIRGYRYTQAINNTICSSMYGNNGIAKGVTSVDAPGIERCKYCYKIAYVKEYCSTETEKSVTGRCPEDLFTATDLDSKIIANGMCSAAQWAESVN